MQYGLTVCLFYPLMQYTSCLPIICSCLRAAAAAAAPACGMISRVIGMRIALQYNDSPLSPDQTILSLFFDEQLSVLFSFPASLRFSAARIYLSLLPFSSNSMSLTAASHSCLSTPRVQTSRNSLLLQAILLVKSLFFLLLEKKNKRERQRKNNSQ